MEYFFLRIIEFVLYKKNDVRSQMMYMAQFSEAKKGEERIILDTRLRRDVEKREERQDGSQGRD